MNKNDGYCSFAVKPLSNQSRLSVTHCIQYPVRTRYFNSLVNGGVAVSLNLYIKNVLLFTFEIARQCFRTVSMNDDVIKWKPFPRYWPFVRGIHRSPVNSPHNGQWRRAFMFSLICAWINHWVNNREAGYLRRHRAHNDVIVMGLVSLDSTIYNGMPLPEPMFTKIFDA